MTSEFEKNRLAWGLKTLTYIILLRFIPWTIAKVVAKWNNAKTKKRNLLAIKTIRSVIVPSETNISWTSQRILAAWCWKYSISWDIWPSHFRSPSVISTKAGTPFCLRSACNRSTTHLILWKGFIDNRFIQQFEVEPASMVKKRERTEHWTGGIRHWI